MRLAALALTGCSALNSVSATAPPTVTDTAAPISLGDQHGQTRTLEQLLGSGHVAIVFYRGHW